jgi:hypothetical protein
LLLQDFDIALLQFDDRRVAQQVHVGDHGIEQHVLLGQREIGPCGEHLRLGLPGAVRGLKAVEQSLRDCQACRERRVVAAGSQILRRRIWRGRRFRSGRQRLLTPARRYVHTRPVSGQGLRHILVDHAHAGALCVQRRIRLVGIGEGAFQRIGTRRERHGRIRDGCQ